MRILGRLVSGIITLSLMGLAVSLAVSNPQDVQLHLWPLSSMLIIPAWLVVIISFGGGLILGALVMLVPLFGSRMQQRRLNKSIKTLEKQKTEISNQLKQEVEQSKSLLSPPTSGDNGQQAKP